MEQDLKYLTPKELAERWRVKTNTLAAWRQRETSPQYYKISGQILYSLNDIIQYEKENMVPPKKCG